MIVKVTLASSNIFNGAVHQARYLSKLVYHDTVYRITVKENRNLKGKYMSRFMSTCLFCIWNFGRKF